MHKPFLAILKLHIVVVGLSEEKISARMLYGVRLDAIDGRKITLSEFDRYSVPRSSEYELHEESEKSPEDLTVYLGEMVDVALVNGKIKKVVSH